MTSKAEFYSAYAKALVAAYSWAHDQTKLAHFMTSVQQSLEGPKKTWNHDGECVTAAWKEIGGKGKPTLARQTYNEATAGPRRTYDETVIVANLIFADAIIVDSHTYTKACVTYNETVVVASRTYKKAVNAYRLAATAVAFADAALAPAEV